MEKEIAYKPNTRSTESLPFPIVLYPGHYGAFFAFKKDEISDYHFCSCAYEAIENYIKLRKLTPIAQNANKHRMYILGSSHFPLSVIEDLTTRKVQEAEIMSSLQFSEKLCHECNTQTPYYRYCHEMYGGAFKQNYGWYINKQAFEWGMNPLSLQYLPGLCPAEVLDVMKIQPPVDGSGWFDLLRGNDLVSRENIKECQKQNRKIRNFFENEVRAKFGHKKVGEAWASETILYYIVTKLFPQYSVRRHYRPKFLGGLELDIYIEELKVGIEYQGIQHYKPVKHWGGKAGLERGKARDKRKREICEQEKVSLIYFEYNEGLNDELVIRKLSDLK